MWDKTKVKWRLNCKGLIKKEHITLVLFIPEVNLKQLICMKYLVHRCSIGRESTRHHPSSWVKSQSAIVRRHCSSINKCLLLEMSLRNSHCLVQGCWHWWRCICSTKLLLSCFSELRNYDTFLLALLILILLSPLTQFPSTTNILL